MIERNKFLTILMGKCWHELEEDSYYDGIETIYYHRCVKCGLQDHNNFKFVSWDQIDFSSWEGFGILYKWAKLQNWWQQFIERYGCCYYPEIVSKHKPESMWMLPDYLIDPELFANAIYEFCNNMTVLLQG